MTPSLAIGGFVPDFPSLSANLFTMSLTLRGTGLPSPHHVASPATAGLGLCCEWHVIHLGPSHHSIRLRRRPYFRRRLRRCHRRHPQNRMRTIPRTPLVVR